jgi:hypothetical protein
VPSASSRTITTKAALLDAAVVEGITALVAEARGLAGAPDPTEAFCAFFIRMIARSATSHALAHRLAELGVDVGPAVASPVRALRRALGVLLRRAQRAGGIRADLDRRALEAVIAGGYAIQIHPQGGPRLVALLCAGLRRPAGRPRRTRDE